MTFQIWKTMIVEPKWIFNSRIRQRFSFPFLSCPVTGYALIPLVRGSANPCWKGRIHRKTDRKTDKNDHCRSVGDAEKCSILAICFLDIPWVIDGNRPIRCVVYLFGFTWTADEREISRSIALRVYPNRSSPLIEPCLSDLTTDQTMTSSKKVEKAQGAYIKKGR